MALFGFMLLMWIVIALTLSLSSALLPPTRNEFDDDNESFEVGYCTACGGIKSQWQRPAQYARSNA